MSISPNMLLTIPVVGDTAGPEYATEVNNSLTKIDTHDHSAGSGVQITPNGLNINSALSMQNNALTLATMVGLSPVASNSTNRSIYAISNELYYRDGVGNQVQITLGGSVNAGAGTITGLPSGTASASYSAINQTFTFQSATSTAANIDAASYIMRNLTASSFGLTIQPPSPITANYSLTLPTLPASKKIVSLTTSGVLAADIDADNVTIELVSNNLQVKDASITTAKLADNSVTQAKIVDLSVTQNKIVDQSVTNAKIADNTIQLGKLAPSNFSTVSFTAISIGSGTVLASISISSAVSSAVRPVTLTAYPFASGGSIALGAASSVVIYFRANGNVISRFDFVNNGASALAIPLSLTAVDTSAFGGGLNYSMDATVTAGSATIGAGTFIALQV